MGCEAGIKFPTVKLLDYAEKFEELKENENPFAVVVMAHIKTKETLHDDKGRKRWKLYLVRRLYERGYNRIGLINLFRFIRLAYEITPGYRGRVLGRNSTIRGGEKYAICNKR